MSDVSIQAQTGGAVRLGMLRHRQDRAPEVGAA
jgi:hypothetical protein